MADSEIRERLEVAKRIAIEAGKMTLEYFQTDNFQVQRKRDGSPLTIADQESERHLRTEIARHFPTDAIVGEEFGKSDGDSGFQWILDPINGTKSFISGVPLYGTMVGVSVDNRAIIGSCYMPGLDEGIFAATGEGAWTFKGNEPPRRAQVSEKTELGDSVLVTSEAETFVERGASEMYKRLRECVYFVRTWGDVYGYFLVATGRVEVMIDPILNIWDAAAVQPIIEEAGGKFTDWSGVERIDAGEAIGSNGHVHPALLEFTRELAGKFDTNMG